MKHAVALFIAVCFLVIAGCESTKPTEAPATQNAGEKSGADQETMVAEEASEEPLLLEEEPLLLDDEPLLLEDEPVDTAGYKGADNSRCHVCHINYATETIAVTHAKAGIGCASCHGESDAHIADESWASGGNGTAPDRMFPRNTINPSCMKCHTDIAADQPQHAAVFASGDEQKVCTDCHGAHRLAVRRCKWK